MPKAQVFVLKTNPQTVIEDYNKLLQLAQYQQILPKNQDIILKLNLSWTRFFPASSTPPWQLEGVLKALLRDGYSPERIFPVENKTVVTNPIKGAQKNKWSNVLQKYELPFIALPQVKWLKYQFKSNLLILNQLFPEGIEIPELFIGKNIIHLPTLKTHGHSITTGAIKNAFGGLLRETRHYAHKYIHETLVDLLIMQREIHPQVFAIMDATVCGDGAGPRTMIPKIANYILASADSLALDAIAAKLMGFDPLNIPYIKLAHQHSLGCGNPAEIEIVGEDISNTNLGFRTRRSLVIWGDQMLRKGFLQAFEGIALHSPLVFWAPLASNIYHELIWYPLIGRKRLKAFLKTDWGQLFLKY